MKLDSNQKLLVTVGSRGIGAATARKAAERGFFVCINFRGNAVAAESMEGSRDCGGDGKAIQADVGDEKAVAAMFEAVDTPPGTLVGLVNSTGIVAPATRPKETDPARWREIFRTNVFGTKN